jgi:predicted ester cyclase
MSEANKETIRRFVAEAFVQGKVGVVDEVYSEEYFDHSLHHAQLWGIGPDREGFKQLIRMVIGGLSDLEAEVDLMVAEDEFVAARVLAKGIHSGPYMGIPPTGNLIELSDWHYWRFGANGQIVEHWNQYNALEVMQQLGVIPQLPDPDTGPAPAARDHGH